MTCPALQLEASKEKRKRNRFSPKHRSDGKLLADALRRQRKRFPTFAEQLDDLIRKVVDHSKRTRAGDREKVLKCLRDWGGLSQHEIMEDTSLSRWDVRQILYELIDKGLVREDRPQGASSRPQWSRSVYWLIK